MVKVTKPCERCGNIMHNVSRTRKICDICKYGHPMICQEEKPKKGPSLEEIMREADKEGLQYGSYCRKHGLC